MFEYLKDFRIVLVTGPQRSGTRICARMIANDTRLQYVDEQAFNVHNEENFTNIIQSQSGVVVQCPGMCHCVHKFSANDVAVVLMLRDPNEILKSQQRIGWNSEHKELAKYGRKDAVGAIADVKYAYWLTCQRSRIRHIYEIAYHSLSQHPLWIPDAKRRDFKPAQWKLPDDD